MKMGVYTTVVFLIILSCQRCYSFYIPGVTPNEFDKGEAIEVKAVKMTSSKTQIPYDYYALNFCQPKTKIEYGSQNIGEILRGDRTVTTPYEIKMAVDQPITLLCDEITLSEDDVAKFVSFIFDDYSVHLVMDNLPSATLQSVVGINSGRYIHGYKLGITTADGIYINNHLIFRLQYNTVDNNKHRFVGFEVVPLSVSHEAFRIGKGKYEIPSGDLPISKWKKLDNKETKITFSYEVIWESSNIRWASRWDVYLKSQNGQVHWFSLINSLVIVMFLTAVIAMILIRTLRRDIAKYNKDDDAEDIIEESGWKLVHGDVFRPPRYVPLLTALFGSGVQIFCMVFIVIFFAMLGTLSPASRGALMTSALFTYVFMGLFAGYFAGRLYRTLRGLMWKSTALFTGVLFPMTVLSIGAMLNSFLWYKGSSASLPFSTVIALLAMWLGISLPLIYVGFYFGYRKRGYEFPVRTNQIPRAVPQPKMYQNIFISTVLSGALPFGAVFIEVFFIYLAIWESRFYYLFGFLFTVFIILIICVSQVAVVLTYFQLCNEDYHWWWHTFISSGGSALYLFVYSVCYYWSKLEITEFVPTVVYFGHISLIVLTFWILTGTIGLTAVFFFLRHIYSAIKID